MGKALVQHGGILLYGAFLLPKLHEAKKYSGQVIFSEMIDCTEFTAENNELLCMEDWFNILKDYIDTEARVK